MIDIIQQSNCCLTCYISHDLISLFWQIPLVTMAVSEEEPCFSAQASTQLAPFPHPSQGNPNPGLCQHLEAEQCSEAASEAAGQQTVSMCQLAYVLTLQVSGIKQPVKHYAL